MYVDKGFNTRLHRIWIISAIIHILLKLMLEAFFEHKLARQKHRREQIIGHRHTWLGLHINGLVDIETQVHVLDIFSEFGY